VDIQLLEEATEDLPTTIIKVHHQPPKAEAPTGETGAIKAKVIEETKIKTMVETMTKRTENIVRNQITL
jgi:hypothetical protein